jgi:hypothetical protein
VRKKVSSVPLATEQAAAAQRTSAIKPRRLKNADPAVDFFFIQLLDIVIRGYGRGAGVGRGEPIGVGGGVMRGGGVGRSDKLGRGLGVGEHLPVQGVGVAVGVGDAVAVGVTVAVGLAVTEGVGVDGGADCAQYLPPVLTLFVRSVPPQTVISLPIHTAL